MASKEHSSPWWPSSAFGMSKGMAFCSLDISITLCAATKEILHPYQQNLWAKDRPPFYDFVNADIAPLASGLFCAPCLGRLILNYTLHIL